MPQRSLSPEEFDIVYRRAIKQAPADLSQAEFDDYVHQQASHEEAAKAGSVAPGASEGLSFSPSGILGGFLKGAKGVATGLGDLLTTNPLTTIGNAVSNQGAQFGKAADDYRQGRYSEMIGHGVAGALPLMGPAAADLGERTAESGDLGNALGEASLMALLSSPSVMKPAVAQTARLVKPAARVMAATGRGLEAGGRFTGGEVSKLGGLATILHGEPVTGAALLAGPKAAEAIGGWMRRGGDSIASLKGEPGDWVTRQPPAPTHADLNAWGAKQYTAGRARQDAAAQASGVAEDFRDIPSRKFGDVDTSWDTDFMQHGGEAPSHNTPGVPTVPTPRNKFVTSRDVPNVSEAQMAREMANTPANMAKARIQQPTFEGDTPRGPSPAQLRNEEALTRRRAEYQARQEPSMESLLDSPSFAALPDEEAMAMALVGRKQTGRW